MSKHNELTKAIADLVELGDRLLKIIVKLGAIDAREVVIETRARPALGLGRKRRKAKKLKGYNRTLAD